ncbi:MAG: anti-sigma factor family protein [Blastocatellia bacterium]
MPIETRHFKEEMQELLDDRLNHETRLEVERHLESCEECRRELEALRWTKRFAHQQYAPRSAPAKLEENILKALALEDSDYSIKPIIWWRQRRAILAYGLALAAGVVLALSYFMLRTPYRKPPEAPTGSASLPSAVAQDYRNYQAEKLPLMLMTGDVKEMERFFSAGGIAFDTRVFDLAMMNYRLVGGRVHQLLDRQSALFVYRGKDNRILICQMYPGQVTELPPAGAILRENKGIRFYIYRVNGLAVAFWQEGAVTCVLTSEIDPEEVVQLAFAKAVKI